MASQDVLRLRSLLGAATKRANENRDFGLKQLAREGELQQRECDIVNMLVIALLTLDSGVPSEVSYFVKIKLEEQLVALFPKVARRLGRDEPAPRTGGEQA